MFGFWAAHDRYPLRRWLSDAIQWGTQVTGAEYLRQEHVQGQLEQFAADSRDADLRASLQATDLFALTAKPALELAEHFGRASWGFPEGSPPFDGFQAAASLLELAALKERGDF